jgi:predicted amidohydrolase
MICGFVAAPQSSIRGVVIAAASADREELIQVETLEDAVKSVRGRMEVFAHRRPDVCR